MVADGMAFFDDPAQETGVFLDLSADHEKRRLYVVLSQGREDSGRGARGRAVVESERDPAPEVPGLSWVARSGDRSPAIAAAQTFPISGGGWGGSGRVPACTGETCCTHPNSVILVS